MTRVKEGAENVAEEVSKPHETSGKRAGGKLSRRSYGDVEIERALIARAWAKGDTHLASRELAEDGLPIDQKTLWRWSRKLHAERYERTQVEFLPAPRARAAEEHMDLAAQQMSVVRQMTDRLAEGAYSADVAYLACQSRETAQSRGERKRARQDSNLWPSVS